MGPALSVGDSSVTLTRENWFPLPSRDQLQIASWLGETMCPLRLPSVRILSALSTCRTRACCPGLCEFIWVAVSVYIRCCLLGVICLPPPLLQSFCIGLWACRARFDRDIPFRAQCSTVPYSLHIVCLRISALIPIWCQKKASEELSDRTILCTSPWFCFIPLSSGLASYQGDPYLPGC